MIMKISDVLSLRNGGGKQITVSVKFKWLTLAKVFDFNVHKSIVIHKISKLKLKRCQIMFELKSMQSSGSGAIRIHIQHTKPRREVTNIKNS